MELTSMQVPIYVAALLLSLALRRLFRAMSRERMRMRLNWATPSQERIEWPLIGVVAALLGLIIAGSLAWRL